MKLYQVGNIFIQLSFLTLIYVSSFRTQSFGAKKSSIYNVFIKVRNVRGLQLSAWKNADKRQTIKEKTQLPSAEELEKQLFAKFGKSKVRDSEEYGMFDRSNSQRPKAPAGSLTSSPYASLLDSKLDYADIEKAKKSKHRTSFAERKGFVGSRNRQDEVRRYSKTTGASQEYGGRTASNNFPSTGTTALPEQRSFRLRPPPPPDAAAQSAYARKAAATAAKEAAQEAQRKELRALSKHAFTPFVFGSQATPSASAPPAAAAPAAPAAAATAVLEAAGGAFTGFGGPTPTPAPAPAPAASSSSSSSSSSLSTVSGELYTADSTTFEELGVTEPLVLKNLRQMNILRPTRIQAQAVPLMLQQRRSTVLRAQTGSGKTLAYLLPLLTAVDPSKKQVGLTCTVETG
jgi:hypothetical protein